MSPHASTSNIMSNTGDDTFPPAFALALGPFTAQPIQTVNNDFLPTSTYTDEEEQFTAWVLGHASWGAEQSDVPAAEELPPLDIPAASQVTNSFATIGYTLRLPLEAYTPVCVDPQQLVLPLQQATPPNPSWAIAQEYYTPPLSHSYNLNQPAHAYEQIPVAAASSRPARTMVQSQGYVRPNPYRKDWNRRKENGKGKEVVRDIYPAPYPSTGRDPRERITHNNKRSGSSADERNFACFSHNADAQCRIQVPHTEHTFAHEMGNTYREQHMGSRTYHQHRPMQPIPVMALPASASSSSPQPKTKKSRKENNRGTIIQGVHEPPSVETMQRRELEAAAKAEKRAVKKAAKKAAAEEQKAETKRIKLEQQKEEFEWLAQTTEEWESRGGRWVVASIEDTAPSMGVINFGRGK